MGRRGRLKLWALALRRDVVALWIAARDSRTPRSAKLAAAVVAAYALSPIDLIPDFVPVLSYLDDLILVPLGIALAVRLIPPDLMTEFRQAAEAHARPISRWGAGAIIGLWLVFVVVLCGLAWGAWGAQA